MSLLCKFTYYILYIFCILYMEYILYIVYSIWYTHYTVYYIRYTYTIHLSVKCVMMIQLLTMQVSSFEGQRLLGDGVRNKLREDENDKNMQWTKDNKCMHWSKYIKQRLERKKKKAYTTKELRWLWKRFVKMTKMTGRWRRLKWQTTKDVDIDIIIYDNKDQVGLYDPMYPMT